MRTFFAFAAVLSCFCSQAMAFSPDMDALENPLLMQKYPSGSLIDRNRAEHALAEVKRAKGDLDEIADYYTRRCSENFLVNRCVENVRQAKIRQSRRLASIEEEARRVIREDDTRKEQAKQRERDAKRVNGPSAVKTGTSRAASKALDKYQGQRQKRVQQTAQRQKVAADRKAKEAQKLQKAKKREQEKAQREAKRAQSLKKREEKKHDQKKKNTGRTN